MRDVVGGAGKLETPAESLAMPLRRATRLSFTISTLCGVQYCIIAAFYDFPLFAQSCATKD